MSKKRIKIGDIFEIALSDGQRAYGHYVFMDKKGPLIQIYDLITSEEIQVQQLIDSKPLFPPVLTGLFAAVRKGFWKVIGHLPVRDFIYHNFVSTLYNSKTGKARVWFLWNGERSVRIGNELPEKYKTLEYLVIWDPHDINHRIETGKYPEPYRSLREKNEFKPLQVS